MRFGFMLVAEFAALGWFFDLFFKVVTNEKLVIRGPWVLGLLTLCIVGAALVGFFDYQRRITKWWIDRWIKKLEYMEPFAFDEIDVFRNTAAPGAAKHASPAAPAPRPPGSARASALLFYVSVRGALGCIGCVGAGLERVRLIIAQWFTAGARRPRQRGFRRPVLCKKRDGRLGRPQRMCARGDQYFLHPTFASGVISTTITTLDPSCQ